MVFPGLIVMPWTTTDIFNVIHRTHVEHSPTLTEIRGLSQLILWTDYELFWDGRGTTSDVREIESRWPGSGVKVRIDHQTSDFYPLGWSSGWQAIELWASYATLKALIFINSCLDWKLLGHIGFTPYGSMFAKHVGSWSRGVGFMIPVMRHIVEFNSASTQFVCEDRTQTGRSTIFRNWVANSYCWWSAGCRRSLRNDVNVFCEQVVVIL